MKLALLSSRVLSAKFTSESSARQRSHIKKMYLLIYLYQMYTLE
jgi:hypothetical protein